MDGDGDEARAGAIEVHQGILEPSDAALVPSTATFPDSERAIKAYLRSQLSPRSRQNALDSLRRLTKMIYQGRVSDPVEFPWAAIGYEQAVTIRTALYDMTRAGAITPGTANLTISHLRGLIRTMYALSLVSSHQHELTHSGALKNIPGSRSARGRALAPREERALREGARQLKGYQGAMLDTAIVLAIGAGLRREEIARLTLDGMGIGTLSIVGKGNKERRLPIDPQMQAAADAWLEERQRITPGHEGFFCSPQKPEWALSPWSFWSLVRTAAHTAFGNHQPCDEKCRCYEVITGPHDFRRTFATRLLDQGYDIRQVQIFMGHQSPETTARYDKRDVEALFEKRRNTRVIA